MPKLSRRVFREDANSRGMKGIYVDRGKYENSVAFVAYFDTIQDDLVIIPPFSHSMSTCVYPLQVALQL